MRLFKCVNSWYGDRPYHTWSIHVPGKVIESLGWDHRDDLDFTIVDGELRLRLSAYRDFRRDLVPGGRYDPVTRQLKSEVKEAWDRQAALARPPAPPPTATPTQLTNSAELSTADHDGDVQARRKERHSTLERVL